jgi:hypothetical protein
MESMEFLHANKVFTVFFVEDLAFSQVRGILDHLLDKNAFDPVVQQTEGRYQIELEDGSFTVWVYEMDVIIRKG